MQLNKEPLAFEKQMSDEGIDVLNERDPIFNDLCEPFYN